MAFPGENDQPSLLLLVANYPHMTFTQMHERLRLELLRRMRRGTLSVSLLARQTGLGQPHLSNFLHSRRQLSLQALDRVLTSQHLAMDDLLPVVQQPDDPPSGEQSAVPLVGHAGALFEPNIRPSTVHTMLQLPAGLLSSLHARVSHSRRAWQRFVAVRIPSTDAHPMDPVVMPQAIVLIDRHYTALAPYRENTANIYAVRNGSRLSLRYVEFASNRLVLRPRNLAHPVDLIELDPGQSPPDLLAGRVVLVINEV